MIIYKVKDGHGWEWLYVTKAKAERRRLERHNQLWFAQSMNVTVTLEELEIE